MKKLSGISILASAMLLTGLCGCGGGGGGSDKSTAQPAQTTTTTTTTTQTTQTTQTKPKKDKRPIEERLTVGMTMDQVKAACGNPKNESMNSDGTAVWMYNNGQNAFIPYYSLSGGKIHYVTIYFDNAGKVKNWNSSSTGAY